MDTEKQKRQQRGLVKFKKGQSGNPKGRPKGELCLTTLLKKELERICPHEDINPEKKRTWKELIVMATMRLAIQGNNTAIGQVWDRSDGKLKQEVSGEAGGPIVVRVEYGENG